MAHIICASAGDWLWSIKTAPQCNIWRACGARSLYICLQSRLICTEQFTFLIISVNLCIIYLYGKQRTVWWHIRIYFKHTFIRAEMRRRRDDRRRRRRLICYFNCKLRYIKLTMLCTHAHTPLYTCIAMSTQSSHTW